MSSDRHSPLIGYAADGFPIYGYYGYADPKVPAEGIRQMRSGWLLRHGTRESGPGGLFDGRFVEDWLFNDGVGDLDESNARFTATPEYPNGTWACFITEGFPHIPRSFIGPPDRSFMKGRPGGGRLPHFCRQHLGGGHPGSRPSRHR